MGRVQLSVAAVEDLERVLSRMGIGDGLWALRRLCSLQPACCGTCQSGPSVLVESRSGIWELRDENSLVRPESQREAHTSKVEPSSLSSKRNKRLALKKSKPIKQRKGEELHLQILLVSQCPEILGWRSDWLPTLCLRP